jgi:hypothetical protein
LLAVYVGAREATTQLSPQEVALGFLECRGGSFLLFGRRLRVLLDDEVVHRRILPIGRCL